ncbi:glycoside hydrolase family 3 N-terminal domain-containing protein [Paenarthrobacter sp. CCNWLY172]|uniref:beta-N-acetylhexosaminidase n=1 Tax=Paenarthrobacter sp. AMU7 TaxID=3162492 RepID=A0AB39YJK6_9MICC|nr:MULTISPECIES: glycoside hydrolase family 3 N-terminal domain-containing protein [Micrococcaceae]WGM19133.1 glycoside hydrolase family 3 N-terminal domain-containing protein [Paenarthrobacter sp. OM7]
MPPPSAAPATSAPTAAEQQLAALSLEQRVGQLFMVAAKATGAEPGTMQALKEYHAGNVYLSGRSKAGSAATAAVVSSLTGTVSTATTGGLPLFVATDQEGGYVQVLSGPGFSTIPTALVQAGAGESKLRADAATWGKELRSAGVNVNLAPVLDTVTSPEFAPSNAPIGHFQREYGYAPGTVSTLGNAFADGMKDAGVAPVVKHFPGLGRVVPNTDVTSDVRDTSTTRNDPALEPFHAAIASGTQWVMVSNAYYDKIDPSNIAPFSPTVMETMLRSDAGFTGIVLSDDLCSAAQLGAWSDADRALNFFAAGGTMLVCADPASIPAMHQAVVKKATADASFRAKVDAAALTVLRVKAG